jgi:transmembrane sensor
MEAALQEQLSQGSGTLTIAAGGQFPRGLIYSGLAAVACVVSIVVGFHVLRPSDVVYTTKTGELRRLILPDGSEVQLSTRTQMRWGHCRSTRCVTLDSGEAYFTIRRDATHPFVVQVEDGAIRVTGTEFNVRRERTDVEVTVAEGTVLVSGGGNGRPWRRELHVDERLTFNGGGPLNDVHKASAALASSWKEGALEIDDSVPAVICRLSEYIDAPVTYDPRVAEFGIHARLDLTNVGHTLMELPTSAPIVVERIGDSYVVRLRSPAGQSGFKPTRCP